MISRDVIEAARAQLLEHITKLNGPEAAVRKAMEFAERDAAVESARSTIQSAIQFIRSRPLPPPDTALPYRHIRSLITLEPNPQTALRAVRDAISNPTVQRTTVGTGTATAAGARFLGTVSSVFAAPSLSAIGAMGGGAVAVASGAVLLAGAVGVGIGVGIDHLVGAARDDGRTLSDLLSGANQGVPVQDPTGHGTEGWRFFPDGK